MGDKQSHIPSIAPSFQLPRQRAGVQQTENQPKIYQAQAPDYIDEYDELTGDAAPQAGTNFQQWTENEIRTFLDQRGEDFDDCRDLHSLILRAQKCELETGPAQKPTALPSGPKEDPEDEELDPLDAFMAEMKELETKTDKVEGRKMLEGDDAVDAGPAKKKARKQQAYRLDNDDDHLTDFLKARQRGALNPILLSGTARAAGTTTAVGGGAVATGAEYDSDTDVYAAAKAIDAATAAAAANRQGQNASYDSDEEELDPSSNAFLYARDAKKQPIDPLPPLDHNTIEYEEFAKDFYEEASDVAALEPKDVADFRKSLGIRVSGFSVPKPIKNFSQCGFDGVLSQAIVKAGYKEPTPIQAQALPAVLSGRDVLGIAKTGSGKTAAFVLPMIVHVMDQPELSKGEGPIAIIVAPTRELAEQIHREARRFGKPYNLQVCAAFGGLAKHTQFKELKSGAEVAVCTPGRMIDLIKMKACTMKRVTYLVFDEADRMFDMGFEPQVRSLVGQIRPDRQTLLFSATMPRKVERLAADVLTAPLRITVGELGAANEDVKQVVEVVENEKRKQEWLKERLGEFVDEGDVLVFANQKGKVEELTTMLAAASTARVGCIHGDMDQLSRMEVLKAYKAGNFHVLVATDVAARGLDIKSIKTVVNYDVAKDIDTQIHRIGRTGRAGDKEGVAYTLILSSETRAAVHLVQCLAAAGQEIPEALHNLAATDPRFKKGFSRGGKKGGKGGRNARKGSQVGGLGLGFVATTTIPSVPGSTTNKPSGGHVTAGSRGSFEDGHVTGFAPSHAREDVHFVNIPPPLPPLPPPSGQEVEVPYDPEHEHHHHQEEEEEQKQQPPLPPPPPQISTNSHAPIVDTNTSINADTKTDITSGSGSGWGDTKREFVNQQFKRSFVSSGTRASDIGTKAEIVLPKVQPPQQQQQYPQGQARVVVPPPPVPVAQQPLYLVRQAQQAQKQQQQQRYGAGRPRFNQNQNHHHQHQQQPYNQGQGGYSMPPPTQNPSPQTTAAQAEALQKAVAQAQAVAARLAAAQGGLANKNEAGGQQQQQQQQHNNWQWGSGGR